MSTIPVAVSPSHFTGKERDTESNLDYFGARYYASMMMRWTSPDWSDSPSPVPYAQLGDPQSLNLYGYVRNNPIAHADVDGHLAPPPSLLLGSDHYEEALSTYTTQVAANFAINAGVTQSAGNPSPPKPQQGLNPQAKHLINAQDSAMGDPNLQPGAHKAASHCSEATCQISRAVDANTSPLGPDDGGFYDANTQMANLAQASATEGSGRGGTDEKFL